jgi:hypothetical protein
MQHRDQAIADAIAELVRPIEWQYFVTVEFPWNVRPETADRKFNALINELERSMKTRIGFLVGKENRTKSGAPVPWHFHCVLAALRPIDASKIEAIWCRLVHRTKSPEQDVVLIEPYNAARRGVEYIVKMIGTLDADWDFNWLHLFNPAIEYTPKFDHRSLRGDRRWQQQTTLSTQGQQPSGVRSGEHLNDPIDARTCLHPSPFTLEEHINKDAAHLGSHVVVAKEAA